MKNSLWTPSPERRERSQMLAFQRAVAEKYQLPLSDYNELHKWSIEYRESFWREIWEMAEVIHSRPYDTVLENDTMPGTRWFNGSRLNFAENLLRYRDDSIAIVCLLENGKRSTLSYAELYQQAAQFANYLRGRGITAGDRVAGYLPNIAETVVAMLGCTAIGAIWSSCSADFGLNGLADRLGQIEPRLLLSTDGYRYNGKSIEVLGRAKQLMQQVPSIEELVLIPLLDPDYTPPADSNIRLFRDCLSGEQSVTSFEQLPFDHPIYILYSSGTTGIPKCIIHGAGGTLLQHLKEHRLHTDIRREDVFFYFTTCGWMMWNWLVSGLASGCTLVLYEGSPFASDGKRLLDAIDEEAITVFGTGARYLAGLEQQGLRPRQSHRLTSLRTILSTGSPLSEASFDYVYREISEDVCLSSISGGTDIISTFVLGNPTLPVHNGEIQCIGLGMAVEIWNEQAQAVREESGELVCTRAFPSMPIGFWQDRDGKKLKSAYFQQFEGVWAQGDYAEITANNGIVIHGRSDTVLNPGGVRIGTAEIYSQLDGLDIIIDSVVVSQAWKGDVRIILFVVLEDDIQLDEPLKETLRRTIRQGTTPRHVPAKIIQVLDIPRTQSGKTAELAVRNAIHHREVTNRGALANPEALEQFTHLKQLDED